MKSKRLLFVYLGIGVLCLLVFLGFTKIVSKELLESWDFDVLVKMQDRLPVVLDRGWLVMSGLAGMEVTGAVLLIWSVWRRNLSVFWAWIGLGLGLVIIYILKQILHHPGPVFMFYRGEGEFNFSDYYLNTAYSYPSGHSFRMSYLLGLIVLELGRWRRRRFQVAVGFAVFIVVMISVAKLVLGHHWASDVIAGNLLGVGMAFIMIALGGFSALGWRRLRGDKKIADNES